MTNTENAEIHKSEMGVYVCSRSNA